MEIAVVKATLFVDGTTVKISTQPQSHPMTAARTRNKNFFTKSQIIEQKFDLFFKFVTKFRQNLPPWITFIM